MKQLFLITWLLGLCNFCFSTNYYFSAVNGKDNNTGTIAFPYKTLAKLNNLKLKPGDSVLLKSNEFFYGSIYNTSIGAYNKPIVLSTYKGILPAIVSGLTVVTNWQPIGNGIYATGIVGQSKVNNVVLDNAVAPQGRYPGYWEPTGGFLVYDSFKLNSNSCTIYSNALITSNIGAQYVGAKLKIKSYLGTLDEGKILSISGNSLTFDNSNMFYQLQIASGGGFFITDNINTLDVPGEWYYDSESRRLFMCFGNEGPTNHKVEVSTIDITYEPRSSYYVVDNIVFVGANKYGVSCNYANLSDLTLKHVRVLKSGVIGVGIANRNGLVIDSCLIDQCNTTGIDFNYNCDNVRITNSTIQNVGLIASNITTDALYQRRMGYAIISGIAKTKGLYLANSIIKNIAYIGVYFKGSNNFIYKNYFENTCLFLDDGGAIYCEGKGIYNGANNIVRRNIVLYTRGYSLGYRTGNLAAVSIFMDDGARGVRIDSNYCYSAGETLVSLHNAGNIKVYYNNFVNGGVNAIMMQDDHVGGNVYKNTNIDVQRNYIYQPSNYFIYWLSASGDTTDNTINNFGTIDYNYLAAPLSNYVGREDTFNFPGAAVFFWDDWQRRTPFDKHSVFNDTRGKEIYTYYAAFKDSTIHLPGTWVTLDGKLIRDSVRLPDHTGITVIRILTT